MRDDRGFTTIQYVAATALSMVLFVLVANLLVDVYARGVVRDALDEGVRAAAPVGASIGACEHRARDVVGSLGGGSLLHVEALECTAGGSGTVVASARVSLRSWLPGLVPAWHMELRASARREA